MRSLGERLHTLRKVSATTLCSVTQLPVTNDPTEGKAAMSLPAIRDNLTGDLYSL